MPSFSTLQSFADASDTSKIDYEEEKNQIKKRKNEIKCTISRATRMKFVRIELSETSQYINDRIKFQFGPLKYGLVSIEYLDLQTSTESLKLSKLFQSRTSNTFHVFF